VPSYRPILMDERPTVAQLLAPLLAETARQRRMLGEPVRARGPNRLQMLQVAAPARASDTSRAAAECKSVRAYAKLGASSRLDAAHRVPGLGLLG
jgi:hypothetical protein